MTNKNQNNDIIESQEQMSCNTCDKKSVACISFFAHENAMMHKDTDNQRAHRSNMVVCLTIIVLTLIFVCAYTFRMNAFIDLIKEMNAVILRLANAKGILSP